MTFSTLFGYLFCMMAAGTLLGIPPVGGALYLTGRVAVLFSRFRQKQERALITRGMRRTGNILLLIVLVLTVSLLALSPVKPLEAPIWLLLSLVLMLNVHATLSRAMTLRCASRGLRLRQAWWRYALLCALCAAPSLCLMLIFAPGVSVWALSGGFAVTAAAADVSLWQERARLSQDDVKPCDPDALRGVYAYRMFQFISLFIVAALQVTLVIAYTYIGVSDTRLLLCMLVACFCTYFAKMLTDRLLLRVFRRERDPMYMVLVGLLVWGCGLFMFVRNARISAPLLAYGALALCTCGATLCLTVLSHMQDDLRRVAAFATGASPDDTYDHMQEVRMSYAVMLGQLAALLLVSLLVLTGLLREPGAFDYLSFSGSALLIVPAVGLLAVAFVCTLRFPLTVEYLGKLRRFFLLKEDALDNPALVSQLNDVVVKKSKRRTGVRIIMFLIRPFYYHKLVGLENVHIGEDGTAVLLCNHGELYGPVVTNLYLPIQFRPWAISEIYDSKDAAEYLYRFTFKRQKWLLPFLRHPTAVLCARLLSWLMHSMGCIPVYRDQPRKLIATFRKSIEAMQAGDNILLFPENPNAAYQNAGYSAGGDIAAFFTGFVMLGSMLYERTGKRVQFIPLYASKEHRTITFGQSTFFDPDALPVPEKQRIADHLRGEMLRMRTQAHEGAQ